MTAQSTLERAHGKWRQILPALGVPSNLLNGKPQACPFCGGKDRFVFDDKAQDGDFFCRQCMPGKGLTFLMRFHDWSWQQARVEVDKIMGDLPEKTRTYAPRPLVSLMVVKRLWNAGAPLDDMNDPASAYLRRRGLTGPWPETLRYVDSLKHTPSNSHHPCMLALFTDAFGKIATVHRTYLADVKPRRMFLPITLPKGGAIRLGEPAEFMGIAEGIETALSASKLFSLPVWATTSELMLRHWRPPSMVRGLMIFGDNDLSFVGQVAAYELAKRLRREKPDLRIVVAIPVIEGIDWNDALQERT